MLAGNAYLEPLLWSGGLEEGQSHPESSPFTSCSPGGSGEAFMRESWVLVLSCGHTGLWVEVIVLIQK